MILLYQTYLLTMSEHTSYLLFAISFQVAVICMYRKTHNIKKQYVDLAQAGTLEIRTQRFELWKLNIIAYGFCIIGKMMYYFGA